MYGIYLYISNLEKNAKTENEKNIAITACSNFTLTLINETQIKAVIEGY